jgi:Cysteine-rich secretory protein family
MNVKQCEMKHDECRNTKDFKFAGQNLCTRKKSKEFENLEGSIDNCITTWFNEKEFATQDDIKKCCNLESTNPIGHFTVMVNDRANAVGCGMIRFKRKGKLQTLMACNYSFTNIIDKRVYTAGKATSDCIQGANPDFDALCSETEEINNSEA